MHRLIPEIHRHVTGGCNASLSPLFSFARRIPPELDRRDVITALAGYFFFCPFFSLQLKQEMIVEDVCYGKTWYKKRKRSTPIQNRENCNQINNIRSESTFDKI